MASGSKSGASAGARSQGLLRGFLRQPTETGSGEDPSRAKSQFAGHFDIGCLGLLAVGKKPPALTTLCPSRKKDVPRSESELKKLVDAWKEMPSEERSRKSNELKHLLATFVGWDEALRKVKEELARRRTEEKKWKKQAGELSPLGLWWNIDTNRRVVESWLADLVKRQEQFQKHLQELYDSVIEELNAGADMIKYKGTQALR